MVSDYLVHAEHQSAGGGGGGASSPPGREEAGREAAERDTEIESEMERKGHVTGTF